MAKTNSKKNETKIAPIQAPIGPIEIKASEIIVALREREAYAVKTFEGVKARMIEELNTTNHSLSWTMGTRSVSLIESQTIAIEASRVTKFVATGNQGFEGDFEARLREVVRNGEQVFSEAARTLMRRTTSGSTSVAANLFDGVAEATKAKFYDDGPFSGMNSRIKEYLNPKRFTIIDDVCVNRESSLGAKFAEYAVGA